MGKPNKTKAPSLLKMLADLRRSSLFPAGLLIGLGLLGSGGVMLLVPFVGERDAPSVEDLTVSIFGCAAIAVGVLLLLSVILWQLAHEVLLSLDDEYRSATGAETDGQQEGATSECTDAGSRFESPSKSWLRGLSTRDLTAGWRAMVTVALFLGAVLLLLALCAWQVQSVGEFLRGHGVRLDYLCVGAVLVMLIGAYLMPLGHIVHRRARKTN